MKNTPRNILFSSVLLSLLVVFATFSSGQNLVYHYAFNELNGQGGISDLSGNGFDLNVQGNASIGSVGGRDRAFSLNATAALSGSAAIGKNLSAGSSQSLSQYTVTGWMYIGADGDLGGSILSIGNGAERVFQITLTPGGILNVFGAPSQRILYTAADSTLSTQGEWAFFAITVDTTADGGVNWNNAVKLYVGDETASGLTRVLNTGLGGSGSLASTFEINGFDSLAVGNTYHSNANNTGNPNRALRPDASVYDFRMYDGVLSESQLNDIRQQAIPEAKTTALLIGALICGAVFLRKRRG